MGKKNEKLTAKQTSNITPTALVREEKRQLEEYYKSQAAQKKTSEKAETSKKADKKSAAKQPSVTTPTTRQTTPRSADAWTWREPSSEDQERVKRQKSQITPTAITYQERQRVKEIQEDPRRVQAVTPTAITAQERQRVREYNYTKPIDVSTLLPKQREDVRRLDENYARLHPEVQEARAANTVRTNVAAIKRGLESELKRLEEARAWAQEIGMFDAHAEDYDSAVVRNFKRDYGSVELLDKKIAAVEQQILFTRYGYIPYMPDFEEKSVYKKNFGKPVREGRVGTLYDPETQSSSLTILDSGYEDLTYDAINGDKDALEIGAGIEGSLYEDVPEDVVKVFNYIYKTQGKKAAYEYMDLMAARKFSAITTMELGLANGMGLTSLSKTGANALGYLVDHPEVGSEFGEFVDQNQAKLAAQHPTAYTIGNIGGTLYLMKELGDAGSSLASAVGAGETGAAMISGATAFGGTEAVQGLGDMVTGKTTPGDYGLSVLGHGLGGAAGGAVMKGATSLGAKALSGVDKAMGTGLTHGVLPNAINIGVGGAFSTAANLGTRAVIDPNYNPTGEELARDAAVSFAFQTISSALRLGAQTKQAKAALDNEAAALKRDLYRMAEAKKAGVVTDTDLVDALRTRSARLRNTLNSTQYIGHGKEVKDALALLDQLDDFITQAGSIVNARTLPGMTGSSISPGGNLAVPQRELPMPTAPMVGRLNGVSLLPGRTVGSQSTALQSAETQDAALLLKYTMEAQGEKTSGQEDPDGGMITKIGSSTKEGWKDGEQREETREDFTQRCAREGLRSVEGKTAVFGYRETGDIHPQEAAGRQVQKELKDLGLASVVMDGTLWINKNGLSVKQFISEAATIPGELIIINSEVGTLPRETAGHEAFHFLYGTRAREKYVEVLQGSLDYSSQAFRDYQDSFVRHYFDGAVDISDIKQLQLFQEELFAYISGDIHEGGHEDVLRRMLWDYDAVKTAWEAMVQEQRGQGGISESIDAQDAPLLIKRELRKIAQTEEAAKAVPLLKKYMLVLPEDGGLKQRGLGDRVAEAMQKDLKERGRAEEEAKPLRERLARVQAEGEAAMAQIEDRYGRAVAERETETARVEGGETAEQDETELTKPDAGSTIREQKGKKITAITDGAISRVPRVEVPGWTAEQCATVQQQHQELLRYARAKNQGKEVAFVFRPGDAEPKIFSGTDDSLDFGSSLYGTDLIVMHNHPRNSSFSATDISFMLACDGVQCLTIVKNDGGVELLIKTADYEAEKARVEWKRYIRKYCDTVKENKQIEKAIRKFLSSRKGDFQWVNMNGR